ncbi:Pectinesterase [Macleaya cordata]|uniref:Pectinesterase n=1 Tax=Macleaya cordata TaxID=56857 RepID=A0A200PRY0_MACCD|nr:Pectinesterase [Macleaya cordata]
MGYGRLGSSESIGSIASLQTEPIPNQTSSPSSTNPSRKKRKLILLSLLSFFLLVACAISAVLLVHIRAKASGSSEALVQRQPTQAISKTCSKTRYPDLCVNSLLDFPGSLTAGERDLVHITVNMTLSHVGRALSDASEIINQEMDTRARSAYEDCLELLSDSVDQLSRSLSSVTEKVGSTDDVITWLSAALTNHDTCTEGFEDVQNGYVKDHMSQQLKDLGELVSNSLAIFADSNGDDDFSGIPIQNRRRRLMGMSGFPVSKSGFPTWVTRRERRLLDIPISALQADIVVSKNGNRSDGKTYKTIAAAIKAVPEKSTRRTIIYIRAGRYEENNLKVGKKKRNIMFIGDGKGKTVISGGKSVLDGLTTFHTASFAATGNGFIARDITFENWAGPEKHQAVALRVGADHSVIYRCNIIGYQDSLYVHSQRQFYRECDIYGTVDFIFGNAAVVIQNCSIYARKPMTQQKNTITAQNRKDPNQNTGISIHNCKILATPDLEASKSNFPTYLGRPWKMYSRTVYMLSYIGDHIDPRGWLEWNDTFALDTLYYGEYMNYGPGAGVAQRVTWSGYRVITSAVEAAKFTVAKFIYGSSWLPSTGVAYVAGLSV